MGNGSLNPARPTTMIAAIVHQELLLGSRRTRLHVFRWIYAGWLIAQVCWFWFHFQIAENDRHMRTIWAKEMGAQIEFHHASPPSVIGDWFCTTFVPQQLLLLLLAVPPLVCGAIADEKRRGTLIYLLTTDLDTRHILLGKLIGRMVQVLALLAAGLPLFALFAGFAGIQLVPLLLLALTLVPPLFALAAASLFASVVCRQTRDAVLALYLLGGAAFGITWLVPGLTAWFDPRWVVAPVWGGVSDATLSAFGQRFLLSVVLWGGLGVVCLALSLWLLRPLYRRELENAGGARLSWYTVERPRLTNHPLAWRECNVEGLSPFEAFKRMPLWLACVLIAGVTALTSVGILVASMPAGVTAGDFLRAVVSVNFQRLALLLPGAAVGFLVQSLVVLLIAMFIVGVRTSGTITGERERGTWDALLTTTMKDDELVRDKLRGVLTASFWYLLAYAAPALALSILGGLGAFLWTVLGLAVTILGMYFIGAAGVWSSARSSSSWRSLLTTLAFGYLGGVLIFLVTSPALLLVGWILMVLLKVAGSVLKIDLGGFVAPSFDVFLPYLLTAACLGLATAFYFSARFFVGFAAQWIATRERTRHWEEEPVYRLPRRSRLSDRELAARFGDQDRGD